LTRDVLRGGLAVLAIGLGGCDRGPALASAPGGRGTAGAEVIAAAGRVGLDSPTAGEDMAVAYDRKRHRVWLYGGKTDADETVNELWSFDVVRRSWARTDAAEGPSPPPREDHTLVLDEGNDRLVLYGGEDGPSSSETWTFDLTAERWEDVTSPSAPALESHVAIYDPDGRRMIVYGGIRQDENHKDLEDRTWALDLSGDPAAPQAWSVVAAGGAQPKARREHEGVHDPLRHRMLIFGGRQRSGSSLLDDVWELDLSTDTWREIETAGERPNPVRQLALGYDPQRDELTLFGGEVLPPTGEERYPVNQIWVLDVGAGRWEDRTPYPPPVYDHAGVFVPEYGAMVVYGGSGLRKAKEHSTWLIGEGPDRAREGRPGDDGSVAVR